MSCGMSMYQLIGWVVYVKEITHLMSYNIYKYLSSDDKSDYLFLYFLGP